jgi:hypothetical protein
MSKVDDGASDAEAIERQELSRVVVSFSGITDPAAIGLRIEDSADIFPLRLDQDEGSWVKVEERPVAVEVAGASAAGLQIGVGMQPISVAWAGQKKTISTAADWHAAVDAVFASKGAAVDFAVTFQRSSPPMLMPGWARKALRKKQNTRFTSEQRDFLNLMFSQGGGKGERMRPKKVVRLMREKIIFHSQVHPVTGKSLVLSQTQVASYFSRQASKLKKLVLAYHMKEAAGAGDDGGGSDGGDGGGGDGGDGEGGGDGSGDDGDYSAYKVAELKDMCRARSLPVSGKKSALIERLQKADSEGEESQEESEESEESQESEGGESEDGESEGEDNDD